MCKLIDRPAISKDISFLVEFWLLNLTTQKSLCSNLKCMSYIMHLNNRLLHVFFCSGLILWNYQRITIVNNTTTLSFVSNICRTIANALGFTWSFQLAETWDDSWFYFTHSSFKAVSDDQGRLKNTSCVVLSVNGKLGRSWMDYEDV